MKKSLKLLALLGGGLLALASCSKANSSVPLNYNDVDLKITSEWVNYSVPATSVTFADEEKSITLDKGQTFKYSPEISPKKADLGSLLWRSEDENIVTVEKGVITAVNGGNTTIVVSPLDDEFSDVYLSVNVRVPLRSFSIAPEALDLDFSQEAKINVTYDPVDTTEREITFVSEDENVVTVDSNGVVFAKNLGIHESATTKIKAVSPYLSAPQEVEVTVRDKTVHVDHINVLMENPSTGEKEAVSSPIMLEAGKGVALEAEVFGEGGQEATHKEVRWSTIDSDPANPELKYISVNENGYVTALMQQEPISGEINRQVVVTGENNVTKTVDVVVYETIPTKMTVSENELDIDTTNITSYTLNPVYKNGSDEVVEPSFPNTTFVSSDETIAKVNSEGVITAVSQGTATITVSDSRYLGVTAIPVTVNVRKGATGIDLKINNESVSSYKCYPGDTFEVSASVIPADSYYQDVAFEVTTGAVLFENVNSVGNKVTLISKADAKGNAVLTATCGNISKTLNITVSDEGAPFAPNSVYVVGYNGDADNPKGFGGRAHPSWGDSNYAQLVSDYSTPVELKTKVYFEAGDEWKLRRGDTWLDIIGKVTTEEGTHQIGEYKINEGAFADGKMEAIIEGYDESGTPKYTNIRVNQTGFYDIYYAYYTDELAPAEGWYSIYVGDHNLAVNKSTTTIVLDSTQTVKVSNWNGTLDVVSSNAAVEVSDVDLTTGIVTLTGKAVADDVIITVSDDYNEVVLTADVVASIVTDGYYLIGSINDWVEGDIDLVLTHDSEDTNHYYIENVTLSGGDTLKVFNSNGATPADKYISNERTYSNCGFTLDGEGNIVVIKAGLYTINFYVNGDVQDEKTNHITLYKHESASSSVFMIGSLTNWDTTDKTYALTKDGFDDNYYHIENVSLTTEDSFKIYNSLGANDNERWLSNKDSGTAYNLDKDGNIVVKANGTYNIGCYLSHDQGNHITVTKVGGDPIPSEYYLMHGSDSTSWTKEDLTAGTGEYSITNIYLAAGEEVVINLGGDWRHYDQLKLSAFASSHFEAVNPADPENSNFRVKDGQSGVYNFYIGIEKDSSGDYAGKSIWVEQGTSPIIGDKYYIQLGTSTPIELVERDLTPEEEAISGLEAVYEAQNVSVTKDDKIAFYAEDTLISSNIGPDQDDLVKSLYNNFMGTRPDNYTIQASANLVTIKLSRYADGYSFWIPGGDSAIHEVTDIQKVYFTNNYAFETVYAYAFNSDTDTGEAEWPGNAATLVGKNAIGQDVYSYDVDLAKYDSIVFNNGSDKQTKDISLDPFVAKTGYWCEGESSPYNVGSYTFGMEIKDADKNINLQVGGNYEVPVYLAEGEISVKSNSNPSIASASINDGKVAINAPTAGTTTIVITDGVRDISIKVTVVVPSPQFTYTFTWTESGVYADGGCNVVAWIYTEGESGHFVDCTYISQNSCSVTVDAAINRIILVQIPGGKTAKDVDWDDDTTWYNQAGTVSVSSSTLNYVADWPW